MGKLFVLCLMSLVILVQCGGEATGTAFAQEGAETDDGTEVSSGVFDIKGVAITGAGGDVAVDSGYAANGTILSVPAGFTAAQCKFTASLAVLDGSALSAQVSVDNATGEIVCQKIVQEREQVPAEVKDCTAAFMIVCAK